MVSPTKITAATDLGKLLGIVWFDYYKGAKDLISFLKTSEDKPKGALKTSAVVVKGN